MFSPVSVFAVLDGAFFIITSTAVIGLNVNTATGNSNDTTYAAIFQGGNVGIGTTTPSSPLDVNGDTVRIRTAKTPSSATEAGNQGDFAWDANYLHLHRVEYMAARRSFHLVGP